MACVIQAIANIVSGGNRRGILGAVARLQAISLALGGRCSNRPVSRTWRDLDQTGGRRWDSTVGASSFSLIVDCILSPVGFSPKIRLSLEILKAWNAHVAGP